MENFSGYEVLKRLVISKFISATAGVVLIVAGPVHAIPVTALYPDGRSCFTSRNSSSADCCASTNRLNSNVDAQPVKVRVLPLNETLMVCPVAGSVRVPALVTSVEAPRSVSERNDVPVEDAALTVSVGNYVRAARIGGPAGSIRWLLTLAEPFSTFLIGIALIAVSLTGRKLRRQ